MSLLWSFSTTSVLQEQLQRTHSIIFYVAVSSKQHLHYQSYKYCGGKEVCAARSALSKHFKSYTIILTKIINFVTFQMEFSLFETCEFKFFKETDRTKFSLTKIQCNYASILRRAYNQNSKASNMVKLDKHRKTFQKFTGGEGKKQVKNLSQRLLAGNQSSVSS